MKIYSEELKKIKLIDVFEIVLSGEWGEENLEDNENTAYIIRTTNFLNDGTLDVENRELVKRKISREKIDEKHLKRGDIIIEKSGGSPNQPVGRVVYFDIESEKNFLCNNFTSVLRVKEGIEPKYIFYFLKDCYKKRIVLKYQNKTTGIINLKLQDYLKNTEIQLPNIEIQKKIVEILDKAFLINSLLIEKERRISELNKCLFEEVLGNLRTNEKNWEFTALKNICDVRDGTHDSPKYVAEGYPLITSKNILEDKIDFFNVNYISKLDLEKINKRSKVDRGDILMPMIGTIGNPIIVNVEKEFAIKNVALLKFDKLKQDNIFIKEILSSNYFLSIVKEKNRGGTQKFLSLNDIRNIPIPIVSEEIKAKVISTSNLVQKSKFELFRGVA